ncbi:MAG: MgtC/SapB family protein [Saccharofermentanales bacterium]
MLNVLEILIRLGLAILAGFVVGFEREHHHRPAGIKTHILVCMGATVISLIQIQMIQDVIAQVAGNPKLADILKTDYGRLGAQVISGIGFLGAGTILRTKGSIKGLTTAATLWLVACVGLGIGMGYYVISVITIILVMMVLTLLRFVQKRGQNATGMKVVELNIVDKRETIGFINEYFLSKAIHISNIEFLDEPGEIFNGKTVIKCLYTIKLPDKTGFGDIARDLSLEENIVKISETEE